MNPQLNPRVAQSAAVRGVQVPPAQTLGVPPPPQTAPTEQAGQVTTPPQPSAIGPHWFGWHAVIGLHVPPPSATTVPPPHTFG
jgi:hypothetical protein